MRLRRITHHEAIQITLWLAFIGVLAVFPLWSFIVDGRPLTAADRSDSLDDAADLLRMFGKPDIDDSTAYDKPRPPMVTRIFTYRREKVKAIFVANAKMGEPPPYIGWKLVGFTDGNNKLTTEEAFRRLKGRAN